MKFTMQQRKFGKVEKYETLASEIGVTSRTLRRWEKKGCDLEDPASVCRFVTEYHIPHPKSQAIEKAETFLNTKKTPETLFQFFRVGQEDESVARQKLALKKQIMIANQAARIASHQFKTGRKPTKRKVQSLYLLKNRRNGYYKIGVSFDPSKRTITLQAEDPDVILIRSWENKGSREREWHRHFWRERLRGEWFQLTPAQIRYMIHKMRSDE